MVVHLERRLVSVEDYHKMGAFGILKPDDRVELIRGEIIKKRPFKSSHTSCVKRITALMYQLLGDQATISVQDPITIQDHSEPEPDIAFLTFSPDYYAARHPGPKYVLLIIEVSDSTLDIDRHVKLPLYAQAGIKEYWIVNVTDQLVEVYQNPEGNNYKLREIFNLTDKISLKTFGLSIAVAQILGNTQ